jgi:hypothetical protein
MLASDGRVVRQETKARSDQARDLFANYVHSALKTQVLVGTNEGQTVQENAQQRIALIERPRLRKSTSSIGVQVGQVGVKVVMKRDK